MENIKDRIALGEDSKNQFKEKIHKEQELNKVSFYAAIK